MATTSTKTYCTDRDLLDVFPGLSGFDLKTRIYNWTKEKDDFDATSDLWYCANTGLITQLFIDGQEVYNIPFPSTQKTQLDGSFADGSSGYVVDSTTGIELGDIIKVDSHYSIMGAIADGTTMSIAGAGDGSIAAFNTLSVDHADDTSVFLVVDASEYDSSTGFWFTYDSDMDMCIVAVPDDIDPRNLLIEAGDDWATIKTRFRQKASRMIEARLDAKLTKDIWYDREKNYPDIVVRLTALETIILLISAHEPNNEFLESFKSERNELLEGLNNGTIVLPSMRTKDSSEGSIRTVSTNAGSDLIPVELRGNYNGGGYELLKVFIDTSEGGLIGVAKMTVHGKSDTKLKDSTQVLVDSEVIDGDYQYLGVGNLYIRWGGDDVATAVCTAADEYEIELYAKNLGTSVATNHGTIHLTRR